MKRPPETLDGARVLFWAWSEPQPFFRMPAGDNPLIDVHGLAICRYEDSGSIYRFSCDASWEVENDASYQTVEQALSAETVQYAGSDVNWQQMGGSLSEA